MEAEVIHGWLLRKARTETLSSFLTGALYTSGGFAALVIVGGGTAMALLIGMGQLVEVGHHLFGIPYGLRFTLVKWSWLTVVMILLMFFVESHSLSDESSLFMRMFMDIFYAGPRFLREGAMAWRNTLRWQQLNLVVCARTMELLLQRGQRVALSELSLAVKGFDPSVTVKQMLMIDGVVWLSSAPKGMTLTGELRQEFKSEENWTRSRRVGYGGDRLNVKCQVCGNPMRIRAFLVGLPHKCPKCHTRYHTFLDANGQIRLEREAERKAAPAFTSGKRAPHEILGVDENATAAEIKRAYRRLMKQKHPDLFSQASAEKRRQAEEETKAINHAYEELRTRSGR